MANEVSVIIRAKDLASGIVRRFNRTLSSVKRVAKTVAAGIAGLTLAAAGYVTALGRLAQRGAEVIAVKRAFNRVMGNGAEAIQRLRDATGGLITDYTLMSQANQAVALGAARNIDDFEEMARVSLALGRALDIDVNRALQSITTGIARQSVRWLDNIGIIVDAAQANRDYAEELNKSTADLTENERRIAFRNAAMEAARSKLEELGVAEDNAGNSVTRSTTAVKNFIDRASELVATSPHVKRFFDELADLGNDIVSALEGNTDDLLATVRDVGSLLGTAFGVAFNAAAAEAFDRLDRAFLPSFLEERAITPFGMLARGAREDRDRGASAFGAVRESLRARARAINTERAASAEGDVSAIGDPVELNLMARRVQLQIERAEQRLRNAGVDQRAAIAEELDSLVTRLNAINGRTRQIVAQARGEGEGGSPGTDPDADPDEPIEEAKTFAELVVAEMRRQADQAQADRVRRRASRGAGLTVPSAEEGLAGMVGTLAAIEPRGDGMTPAEWAAQTSEGGRKLAVSAEEVTASMLSAAEAAATGSASIEQSIIGMVQGIISKISGGGLLGGLVGGVVGIVGGLLTRDDQKPVPVQMTDVSDRAARKIRNDERPPVVQVLVDGMPATDEQLRQLGMRLHKLERKQGVARI